MPHHDISESAKWFADAQSALESVFPAEHAVLKHWNATIEPRKGGKSGDWLASNILQTAQSIFRSALDQLKRGRLKTLVQSVQAETVAELLDQASDLATQDSCVAATVIAGGALETHLRHQCAQNSIEWTAPGSISRYDTAIAQHRNQGGTAIYSATDTKQVGAWGGMRNDAAHDPTKFSRTAGEVRLMIDGVRQFIARTT